VAQLQGSYGLTPRYDRLRKAGMLTVEEMAAILDIHPRRVKIRNRHGPIRGYAYNGKNDCRDIVFRFLMQYNCLSG
jgi:hypothetical protein